MKKIILIFFIWRSYLFFIAAIAPAILPVFQDRFPHYKVMLIESGLPNFVWPFGNFDGVHYLGIAQGAYSAQFTQVFFPLYPITIRIASSAAGLLVNPKASLIIAALIISNVSFLAAILVFHKLISKIFSEEVALWSVLFLVFFPTSFYFGAIYTESLFFLLIISAFYLAGKNIILASILGALASSTRLVGVFLGPALMLYAGSKKIIPLLVVPLGLLSYMFYLGVKYQDPFYFITAQGAFGAERSSSTIILLPQVLFRYIKILMTTNGLPLMNASLELICTIFAFVVMFASIRVKKIKKEWLVFSFLSIILPTLTGTLSSMPRYILLAFPIYVYLALIKSRLVKTFIIFFFIILLSVFTAAFSRGYWLA